MPLEKIGTSWIRDELTGNRKNMTVFVTIPVKYSQFIALKLEFIIQTVEQYRLVITSFNMTISVIYYLSYHHSKIQNMCYSVCIQIMQRLINETFVQSSVLAPI